MPFIERSDLTESDVVKVADHESFFAVDIVDEDHLAGPALHHVIAILTLESAQMRYLDHLHNVYQTRPEMLLGNVFHITMSPDNASGARISVDEFLGPCFDRSSLSYIARVRDNPATTFVENVTPKWCSEFETRATWE